MPVQTGPYPYRPNVLHLSPQHVASTELTRTYIGDSLNLTSKPGTNSRNNSLSTIPRPQQRLDAVGHHAVGDGESHHSREYHAVRARRRWRLRWRWPRDRQSGADRSHTRNDQGWG